MFEDQTVELLPARTVMGMWGCHKKRRGGNGGSGGNGGTVIAVAVNAGNINFGDGDQFNAAFAFADANGGNGGKG